MCAHPDLQRPALGVYCSEPQRSRAGIILYIVLLLLTGSLLKAARTRLSKLQILIII